MKTLLIASLILTDLAQAKPISVHAVDVSPGEETLILLSNGRVLRENTATPSLVPGDKYTAASGDIPLRGLDPGYEYEPTVLESLSRAEDLFREMRYNPRESQCFNRAMVWNFEWFRNHQVNSMKTWLFFTTKYIREFKFDWWFHVAPSVKVQEGERVRDRVLDRKYARGPLLTKNWTDIFIRNHTPCRVIKTYSDYANYPESAYCYVMRTSMYDYQPLDLELLDAYDIPRHNFFEPDLRAAYKDAMDENL